MIIERSVVGSKNEVKLDGVVVATNKDSLEKLSIYLPLDFYSQFDKLFLLNDAPKARVEKLNEMFDIEKLEEGRIKINSDIKSVQAKAAIASANLTKAELDFEAMTEIETSLKKLYEKHNKTNKIVEALSKLTKSKIVDVPSKIAVERTQKLMTISKICSLAITAVPERVDYCVDDRIYNLLDRVAQIELKRIPSEIAIDLDDRIYNLLDRVAQIERREVCASITSTINSDILIIITKLATSVLDLEKQIESKAELKEESLDLTKKTKGRVCPLCHKQI